MRTSCNGPAEGLGARLSKALPAVLLGTLFNILDAVSTGLLVFPSGGGFQSTQIQAMSMYIMSSILSQVAMTCGGSRFPGALGAMLIEILPFLRGIGSDIRGVLGDDSPDLVPTVMVAYAFTSFLIGIAFILLGALRVGVLVSYFPQTVLTGVIGGVGVSLFVLGLGLPFPQSAAELSLSNAGAVLFSTEHLPLLAASCIPAFFLSYSVRSKLCARLSFGATQHPYYVSLYLMSMPFIFWIVRAGLRDSVSMQQLVDAGWLFAVDPSVKEQSGIGNAWVYWKLYDFKRVHFSALKAATTNIVLLVVIGVLNLPIYVPALGTTLDVPFHMDHEFLGQGAANILAGMAGTLPNILQLSYSVFFTRAGGRRFEASLVIALTFVFFLIGSLVLPYVPTILASALVLFLGIELTLEAVWESTATVTLSEWFVVMATLLACTFIGFAPGFGVGLAAATVVYVWWGIRDTPARTVHLEEIRSTRMRGYRPASQGGKNPPTDIESKPVGYRPGPSPEPWATASREPLDMSSRVRVVKLSGYVFFATIPSLDLQITPSKKDAMSQEFTVLDFDGVHRIETSVVQFLERATRNASAPPLVICGLLNGSNAHMDVIRGGITLNYAPKPAGHAAATGVPAFDTLAAALVWCNWNIYDKRMSSLSGAQTLNEAEEPRSITTEEEAWAAVRQLISGEESSKAFSRFITAARDAGEIREASSPMEQLQARGAAIKHYEPGQVVVRRDAPVSHEIIVIHGALNLEDVVEDETRNPLSRLAVREAVNYYTQLFLRFVPFTRRGPRATRVAGAVGAGGALPPAGAGDGGALVWTASELVRAAPEETCWTLEVPIERVQDTEKNPATDCRQVGR